MSLERLLKSAEKAGGQAVRLIPGRRIVIVTPGGEREVQGLEQTPSAIEELLQPIMPGDARARLQAGRAEWSLPVEGLGAVRALAELRDGATHATFAWGAEGAPPAASPPTVSPGTDMRELLALLVQMKASDLHLCVGSPPTIRHDGEIQALPNRPRLSPSDVVRMLEPIAPERIREEFKRRHDVDFAYEIPGLARFRCNYYVDRKGMAGVFRVIPSQIMTAEEMGLSKDILQLCHLPKGLVLVTGPTGSGKSTTLCALLDYINRNRSDHVITIEDPLEFVHENNKCLINQRQVGEHTNSFKDALRAALREDPDVILVGELRDLETVAIAIETAETGHLVFATLHTSSASTTVDRIIDQFSADRQGQIRVMLSESLKGVVSQILCKKIGGGRVPALEVLIGIPPVANLIREGKTFQIPSVMQTGKKFGMCLMNDALVDLVKRKLVEPREAFAKASDKTGLLSSMRKNAIDVSWAPSESA